MDSCKQVAQVFYALSHPIRLRILRLLSDEEHCVCHLTAALKKRQPYVSQQLAILRDHGLVIDRKDGLMVYYRVRSPQVEALIEAAAEALRAQGVEIDLPPVPDGPIEGCPCPLCNASDRP